MGKIAALLILGFLLTGCDRQKTFVALPNGDIKYTITSKSFENTSAVVKRMEAELNEICSPDAFEFSHSARGPGLDAFDAIATIAQFLEWFPGTTVTLYGRCVPSEVSPSQLDQGVGAND